jgi:hypothetical protein
MTNFKDTLNKEVDEVTTEYLMPDTYRRKKLLIWVVRTALTVVLYIVFWTYEWIRWTLLLYVPLSLFNLSLLLGWNFILNWKVKRLRKKIEKID